MNMQSNQLLGLTVKISEGQLITSPKAGNICSGELSNKEISTVQR